MCVKVLGDDKKLWEDEVYKFARKHQLEVGFKLVFNGNLILPPQGLFAHFALSFDCSVKEIFPSLVILDQLLLFRSGTEKLASHAHIRKLKQRR